MFAPNLRFYGGVGQLRDNLCSLIEHAINENVCVYFFKLIARIKCLHQVFHVHGRIRSPEEHSNVLWANISFKAINVDKLKS